MTGQPPNLLFLYTDEQRTDTLACGGAPARIMPNLDRFSERATVFERAYCTQPVCTPSRGSILTGLYSHAHRATDLNVPLPRHIRCLPEYLPEGAFVTGHFGKWHLGDEIFAQHGFSDWRATEDTYHQGYSSMAREFGPERSHYHHWLVARGIHPRTPNLPTRPEDPGWHPAFHNRFFREQIHRLPEEHSRPAFLAEQTIDFIEANRDHPWVLFVNFLEPHPPFHSCRDQQYDPADVSLAPNWREELGEDRPVRLRERAAKERMDEAELRAVTARYWGMCSLVDTQIGRIFAALEAQNQADNTIVVLTTDHGEMLGSFGLIGKSCMFEESAGVPLMVRIPGQQRQHRVSRPVSQVDLAPTLLELLGQPIPDSLHGRSLRSVLNGAGDETGRDVFVQWNTGHQGYERIRTIVTTDCWKFNRNGLGIHELYDLKNDPHERRNLISDPGCAARVADLRERIDRWQSAVDDPG